MRATPRIPIFMLTRPCLKRPEGSSPFSRWSSSAGLLVVAVLMMAYATCAVPRAAGAHEPDPAHAITDGKPDVPKDTALSRDTPPSISTTNTNGFVAVHGRRSVIMGYPEEGLEVWAYPLQLISRYKVSFKPVGAASEVAGTLLLRRVVYAPQSVTRIYAGPDYVVRETLFVPLEKSAAVIRYEVQSAHGVDVVVHFTPVLDLMWPGALGGQSTEWQASASGYVLREYTRGWTATVGSPEVIEHDSTANTTFNTGSQFSMTLRPHGEGLSTQSAWDKTTSATLVIAFDTLDRVNSAETLRNLSTNWMAMQADAAAHYESLALTSVCIHTPDEEVNSAIAWSQIALDQAWVCNPELGCGMVAGYGPSRAGRRPQYDWFFGGDGLVAVDALVASGAYTRAREELAFIIKYQDKQSGMMWHELSQSAGSIDWSKYPYMFVHVDITFDYLATLSRYVEASGDEEFARANWFSIASAYRYCQSVVRPSDHLPHIPAGKEGGDEQHRPDDDLGLSLGWIAASEGFAKLANAAGHGDEAANARQQSDLARIAVGEHYWDQKENFWVDGHTATGEPIFTRRSNYLEAAQQEVFTAKQNESALDQIATSRFVTDWGVRGGASGTPDFNPWAYSAASVSPLHSSHTATIYWQNHRPATAEAIWRSIVPTSHLDSPGHLHEVLAGTVYQPQAESVPEQTWSSAGFLEATMRGLLGIEVQGAKNKLTFRPHLPAQWSELSVDQLVLPHARVNLTMRQNVDSVDLQVTTDGAAATIDFEPELPMGSRLLHASCDEHPVPARLHTYAEDLHAELTIQTQAATTHCHLQLADGVELIVPATVPEVGDASNGLKIIHTQLVANRLLIDADAIASKRNVLILKTKRKLAQVKGGTFTQVGDQLYEVELVKTPQTGGSSSYTPIHVEVDLASR